MRKYQPFNFSLFQKFESFANKLITRSYFWYRFFSFIFMPAVFKSGVRLKFCEDTFQARLPYSRFNRNSYGTMSGAALLSAAEVAMGGYIFYASSGQFQVMCKNLNYQFRYPCTGVANYLVEKNEQLMTCLGELKPFTMALKVQIYQVNPLGHVIRKIGSAVGTFHARPLGFGSVRGRL